MCQADHRELTNILNQLGYANKMNKIELKKMIKEYCQRFVENIKNFDIYFYPTINDLVSSWSNMETFVISSSVVNS